MNENTARSQSTSTVSNVSTSRAVTDVLRVLRTARQREILARRLGLFGDKESLKTLSHSYHMSMANVHKIVRQARAAITSASDSGAQSCAERVSQPVRKTLERSGGASRVGDLAIQLGLGDDPLNRRRLLFLAEVCPGLHVIKDDIAHFEAISLCDPTAAGAIVERIVAAIKEAKEPVTAEQLTRRVQLSSPLAVPAFARLSKQLAALHGRWGLASWSAVNPRTISDQIYKVLRDHGQPMHFADMASGVQALRQPGSVVSVRSVHNELVRDPRFVAVARGTYALRAWGYADGSISDLIADVLRDAGKPLLSTEIVRQVLGRRPHVKKSSIQSKLCSQPQFDRIALGVYRLNEQAAQAATQSPGRHRLTRRQPTRGDAKSIIPPLASSPIIVPPDP